MTTVTCPEPGCRETPHEADLHHHLRAAHGYGFRDAHDVVADATGFFDAPPVDAFDADRLVDMYRRMRTIRRFEETAEELADAGEVPGNPHLSKGQEAVAVGTCEALEPGDLVASTHRGHGHAIAKGIEPDRALAEIGAKETGTNHGKGGTMHIMDADKGFLGQNAIVGAGPTHATGAALAEQLDGNDTVSVTFFGDGALNQGVLLESMNIAAIWDLPVVFVCENNGYAVSFSWRDSTASDHLPDRVAGMGIPGETIDGQNVRGVYDTMRDAVDRARSGDGPQFVECRTYRYSGHFAAEEAILGDRGYRTDEELEYWHARDPLTVHADALRDAGVLSDAERGGIDDEVDATLEDAVAFMRESERPPPEDALAGVYADDHPDLPAGSDRL